MSARMRRFLLVASLGLVATSVAIAALVRWFSVTQLEALGVAQHEVLARTLSATQHELLVALLALRGPADAATLAARPEVAAARRAYRDPIRGMQVVRIKLYTPEGLTVYSTDEDQLGEDASDNVGVLESMQGRTVSKIVHKDTFNLTDGVVENRNLLETYVPVRAHADEAVLGVFELYSDVTPLLERIDVTQREVVATVALVSGSFFALLVVLFRRNDAALAREQAISSQHLQAVETARGELEQRVAERTSELGESEQRFRDVANASGEYIWQTDHEGRYTFLTPRVESVLGYGVDELLGRRPTELMPDTDVARVRERLRTWGSDQPFRDLEHRSYHKDGRLVWQSVSGLPVLDEAGRVCGYRGAARDITALKRSVAELRESEDRLRTVMDSVLDGIVLIDDAGRIELCNRSVARLFGRPVEEMVGQPVETLMPEPHRSRHHEYLRRYLETGEGRVIGVGGRELEGLRADGSRFPLELAVGELRLDDALKFVGVIRDLTERKHAERELELARSQLSHREKMAAIGQLAAGIVHEVGNPVAAISGAIEVLLAQRARGGEDRAARELEEANLRLIEAQVHRLAGIGREIAEFAGPQPSERQLVDVNQLARSAVALLRYDPRVRSVQLEVRLDPAVPAIRGSADQLTQVLLNLLLNAADACEGLPSARTHVLLATAPDRDGVVIEVRDTGAGMDSETLARAFDAFYTTKSGGRGMGLGLSMCHRIVEHHGGTCSLRSVAGEGTTVRIHLPGDFDPPEGVAT